MTDSETIELIDTYFMLNYKLSKFCFLVDLAGQQWGVCWNLITIFIIFLITCCGTCAFSIKKVNLSRENKTELVLLLSAVSYLKPHLRAIGKRYLHIPWNVYLCMCGWA